MTEDILTQQLGIRVSDEDIRRLDELADRLTIVKRHAIARAALRLGLEILEADPTKLLGPKRRAAKRQK